MADSLDDVYRENVGKKGPNGRCCYPRDDRTTVAGWIKKTCDKAQPIEHECCQRNDYIRHNRDAHQLDDELSRESLDRPLCIKDVHSYPGPSTSRGPCPRKDVLAKLAPTTDTAGIREVIEQVANEEITTAAELIFSLTPYVRDKGLLFREILETELNYFREIVNETVDRRVQDEADVMMHTQNKIKKKFKSLTHAMNDRTMRIRHRLHDICPKFNWVEDGRNKAKISKLIVDPLMKKDINQNEAASVTNSIDKLTHQVFMRGQWLKKELTRLQEENDNLQTFLDKFQKLAAERKEQECYVPRMLKREKEQLDRELNELRKTYKRNLEIIDALYVEHHRCVKPPSESSVIDQR